ncbi:MAG TPA: TIGR03960 family B12-binding radical SAM protein [Candidatus Caccousia avistercoris]|nr:TIGR03960 family B12-binding radical SAM protein [Candidatus Caccousia avistercoris]
MNPQLEKIWMKVQKPGRYTGGELNSVVKDKSGVDVRFAFCFPDIYEVGMSHLGMKILYSLLNKMEGVWCERVFAPWTDMEAMMREAGIPLYGLESGDPVSDFDIIGFTLQYELSYSNVLNMLELSGIPLLARDRRGLSQLVVAGGPCACNPEPLADFVDIFFIGEGEEVDCELVELYRRHKSRNSSKEEFLREAAQIPGVYVPSLYQVEYGEDGLISGVHPLEGAPAKVTKRLMLDMDRSYFPESFVVPYIEIVHNRAVAEVFRGCIRGCRFCQAGFLYRPVREKSPQVVDRQCRALCESTGYDEISLSSLSTSDYSQLNPLLDQLLTWTKEEKTGVSLPSLRVDNFSTELMDKISSVRRSGLTFAPEAGTQRLRDVINKNVTEEELLKTAATAFAGGWNSIKLYFMIGLPTETMEDVAGIAQLGQKVVDAFYANPGRKKGKGVSVTLSASAFVPKAFTPFQWEPQDSIEMLRAKQKHLVASVTTKKIDCNYHDADTSFMEAVFARGDRRLGPVLLKAHQLGCKFDGWNDYFSLKRWLAAFDACGVSPEFYANRRRDFGEILPWDHIDYGVTKDFFRQECQRAYQAAVTPNCREKCSACGAACFHGGICYENR